MSIFGTLWSLWTLYPRYGSQRECEVHRAYRAIDKASSRLKALSKYARKPTRERLQDKLIRRHMFVEEQLDRMSPRC